MMPEVSEVLKVSDAMTATGVVQFGAADVAGRGVLYAYQTSGAGGFTVRDGAAGRVLARYVAGNATNAYAELPLGQVFSTNLHFTEDAGTQTVHLYFTN